ncbi:MAG: hypothetical protein U7M05_09410 [Candidatus Igneacidithiobacillus chanchocoensis]
MHKLISFISFFLENRGDKPGFAARGDNAACGYAQRSSGENISRGWVMAKARDNRAENGGNKSEKENEGGVFALHFDELGFHGFYLSVVFGDGLIKVGMAPGGCQLRAWLLLKPLGQALKDKLKKDGFARIQKNLRFKAIGQNGNGIHARGLVFDEIVFHFDSLD